jgi:hypothetical protein
VPRLAPIAALGCALAALVCLLLWLTLTARPESWAVQIKVTEVDDALAVQTKPCSTAYPQMRLIAITPDRVPVLRGSTVGPERPIDLPSVTANTVITLQLYNDGGVGDLRGAASDRKSRRVIFRFSSPHIPEGVFERVWASSWFGDGRPAPLADGCERGLDADVVRAAAPSARPSISPFRPDEQRRDWLLALSLALLALGTALLLATIALRGVDSPDDLAKIRNVVAAIAGVMGALCALAALFRAPVEVQAVPAVLTLIGAIVAAILEWQARTLTTTSPSGPNDHRSPVA